MAAMTKDNDHHADMSKTYKLFNYVCSQNPEQAIRYIPPPVDGVKQTSKYGRVEPLWLS